MTSLRRQDESFMRLALEEAGLAALAGEIPVGAVLVRDGALLSRAHNLREARNSPAGHAELLAIEAACALLGDWRLDGCTLYVTLEPCPMCAGALIGARVSRVVYAASDPVWGSLGSLINLAAVDFPNRPALTRGVLEEEAAALLRDFFAGLRREAAKPAKGEGGSS